MRDFHNRNHSVLTSKVIQTDDIEKQFLKENTQLFWTLVFYINSKFSEGSSALKWLHVCGKAKPF